MARRRRNTKKPATSQAKSNVTEKSEKTTPPDSEGKESKDEGTASGVPSSNDPEWYSRDAQLLKDAASIPFSYPLGDTLKLFDVAQSDIIPTTTTTKLRWANTCDILDTSLMGVLSLHLRPSVGQNLSKTDPLNVCANAFYTHVRYINSGRKNYDPADLMIYALAFADIYSFTLWAQRLYSYAFMYSQKNKFIAKSLILENGVDPNNIIANLANFRYWINAWINKVSSFALPSDIYFFKRRAFLYANYYIENGYGNIKDQLYQFVPSGFMKFGLDTDGKGCLIHSDLLGGGLLTLSDIINYANDLMSNITGDEDFGLMSGDVLKAYGSNIISLAPMPEEAGLLPVHDPYVLSQFKNATIISHWDHNDTYTYNGNTWMNGAVMQDANGLLISRNFIKATEPTSDSTAVSGCKQALAIIGKKVISSENPDPTPDDVIEASRLMLCWTGDAIGDQPTDHLVYFNSGTEFAEVISSRRFKYNGSSVLVDDQSSVSPCIIAHVSTTAGNDTNEALSDNMMMRLSGFKYHPTFYAVHILNASGYYTVERYLPITNLDNYTPVDRIVLSKLHECALLSLFYVPGVAKMVNNL